MGVQQLLRAALPHIPREGFTLAAVRRAIEENARLSSQMDETRVDRALEQLFPGKDTAPTSAPRRLFQAWDDEMCAKMMSQGKLSGTPVPYESAVQNAVGLLQDRLRASATVQPHLLPVRQDDLISPDLWYLIE